MTEKNNNRRRMRSSGINIENKRKALRTFALTPIALGLAGCGSNEPMDIKVYKDLGSCKADGQANITAECDTAYKSALREADRTSQKFSSEAQCELEYGNCVEMPGKLGWRPEMAAFMVAKLTPQHHSDYWISDQYSDLFFQPLFTSNSTFVDHYGKLFFADGKVIGDYGKFKNIEFEMSQSYLHPLPTVRLQTVDLNPGVTDAAITAVGNGGDSWDAVDTLATAYIASEVIDELGDYSERKHKEKLYKERLKREKEQQQMGTTGGIYSGSNKTAKDSYKPAYKDKPVVKTKSKGGWGSFSSSKSSWGS
ncbi:DUF1190 domain-containing protein [Vibrio parahaemolyticus]|uniref:DUF1190 domain-containing protein n=1 Tax=Vibrio parahaemolyticus TaxID=670 RepID=UPI003D8132A8